MICENLTVGTRIDMDPQPEITGLCTTFKQEISCRFAEKLNANLTNKLNQFKFAVPRPRMPKHLLTAGTTKLDKEKLSEQLLNSRVEVKDSLLDDSKKSKKIIELLVQFEDLAFSQKVVDVEKLVELRKLARILLADALKSEELYKFAHIETIVIAIAMTAATLASLSPKKAFGLLEMIFGKKIKLSKLRKSKGYELMKSIGFRVWDVY